MRARITKRVATLEITIFKRGDIVEGEPLPDGRLLTYAKDWGRVWINAGYWEKAT
jgi:hypothetical protein